MKLILASASPRRADLLRQAGYVFEVLPVDVDERVRPDEPPDAYVRRLASEKSARAHHSSDPDWVTLAADTAVVVDGAILGKPVDDREAEAMLRLLSGRTHEVLTGLSLRHLRREVVHVERTTVEFRPLGTEEIRWHVQSGEWTDKAGGYAIQGLAARFIPGIHGSYSNVVGLPIASVTDLLDALVTETRQSPVGETGRR